MAQNDDIANLTLEYLKRFDTRLERISHDISDLKFRVGKIEETNLHIMQRLDRFDERLDRIEKRLDLVEA